MTWTEPNQKGLMCLPCVIERKQAEAKGHVGKELPPLRPAVTLIASTVHGPCAPHCYEHIRIQTQSQLAVPAPGAVLPGRLG